MTAAIRDAKWIKDRCDEVGDCWIWRQACNGSGQPVSPYYIGGKSKTMLIRRHALELHLGRKLGPKEVAVALESCSNSQCCRPGHAFAGSRKQLMAMAKKRGTIAKGKAISAIRKISARKRANCKLNAEKVAMIRSMHAETGNCREVARRISALGINLCSTYVHKIVTYKAWSDGGFV